MLKLFETVTALPLKGGTCARRKTEATQPPTDEPPKSPPVTLAVVTRPLGANVTIALPVPVGPPGRLHPDAAEAAEESAETAAPLLKAGASAGPGGVSSFFASSAFLASSA